MIKTTSRLKIVSGGLGQWSVVTHLVLFISFDDLSTSRILNAGQTVDVDAVVNRLVPSFRLVVGLDIQRSPVVSWSVVKNKFQEKNKLFVSRP